MPGRKKTISAVGRLFALTITGETHRDAPLISHALVDRGYVFMRWSTIRQNDPLKGREPLEVTTYPLSTMLQHGPIMQRLIQQHQLLHVEVHVMPNFGHQLSREKHGRCDPIDDSVLGMMADWAAKRANDR